MLVRRLTRRGNTVGLVVPTKYLNRLMWGAGDYVALEVQGDTLVVKNVAQRGVAHLQARPEGGDEARTQD